MSIVSALNGEGLLGRAFGVKTCVTWHFGAQIQPINA